MADESRKEVFNTKMKEFFKMYSPTESVRMLMSIQNLVVTHPDYDQENHHEAEMLYFLTLLLDHKR